MAAVGQPQTRHIYYRGGSESADQEAIGPGRAFTPRPQMNFQTELHRLIDALDGRDAKLQLHSVVDQLNEDEARELLTRLRATYRSEFDQWGFSR